MNTQKVLKHLEKRKVIALIVAVALSIIGNAVWEYAAKPLLLLSRDLFLDIATLGTQSFKDACYQSIAQGFSESASFSLLFELNVLYITACLLIALHFFLQLRSLTIRVTELDEMRKNLSKVEKCNPVSIAEKPTIDEQQRELFRSLVKLKVLVWSFVFLAVFAVSLKVMNGVKYGYVHSAITHYRQILVTARPYLTENDFQLTESKFSRIRNKDDYASALRSLYEVCDKNGIKHSTFNPW
ncbi:MAG: hypothetical protein K9G39_04985 [Chlorobium sp.]|uniref:hypothetical protein n=1 Tax=Chlorobium sp. TaxID=1095 RepID=UPI0025C3A672|nr:hypothetical protein [Chlorobium sp.]MCF8382939.1 hypothetical protein [Chlorobium sp.]